MRERFAAFSDFIASFLYYLWMVREVLTGLLLLLLLGGVLISKIEGLSLMEAIYFSFITGLSIGYGDITPRTGLGMCISVAIGAVGMVSTGIAVAIATRALPDTTKQRLHRKEQRAVGSQSRFP
ncbi:potassium channel family protein [Planctomycetaceae bacterium SH139]